MLFSSEKQPVEGSVRTQDSPVGLGEQTLKHPDQAYQYLERVGAGHDGSAAAGLAALRRKVDWNIVPIMFCCYTMQFIDKVLLNVRGPRQRAQENRPWC